MERLAWWRIINWVMLGSMTAVLILGIQFIYSYVYQSLSNARTIIILSADTSINNINLEDYARTQKLIGLKNNPPLLELNLRYPFNYVAAAATTTATATKK